MNNFVSNEQSKPLLEQAGEGTAIREYHSNSTGRGQKHQDARN